ncbi:MAG: SDR family NAD(P)-dependent oxidoreductase [Fuerstiella sp.]|nr:SDR family NAD(P)-dependent oxidoreductase [Fuerstiella sp.]
MDLTQSVAVITGAGSGIGRKLALQLGRKGVRLALNDSNENSLAETQTAVEEFGGKVTGQAFDVSDRGKMTDFATHVRDHYGQTDIVVNNAGVALGIMKIEEVSQEDFEWIINVNMWGVINGTLAFLPMLRERPEANLVNVSSSFGLLGVPLQAPYCASKFAVRGFTESVRLELTHTNICVTLAYPSQVKTNILRNARHRNAEDRTNLVRMFDEQVARISPEDMAAAIFDAIVNRREQVIFGLDAKLYSWASRFAPGFFIRAAARKGLRAVENL